ncbi:UNKNOWN [Stylonychia lemnae]|uniref:Uncharacterized protein n=1 Tax=Stylonychia lemnae TaxID=5949 RepID=A0A078ATM4_STYLE|nr:UNKNOWN [Stylonychia lemnae]|eukprot:CDW84562.1 UNKNOWN [Stylonychia lemnae]
MHTLTLIYCIQKFKKNKNEGMAAFANKMIEWLGMSNAGQSAFVRRQAAICLEELEKNNCVNLIKFMIHKKDNETPTKKDVCTQKRPNLIEIFKNVNDWTAPHYASLISTIFYKNIEVFKIELDTKYSNQILSYNKNLIDKQKLSLNYGILRYILENRNDQMLQAEKDELALQLVHKLIVKIEDPNENLALRQISLRWLKSIYEKVNDIKSKSEFKRIFTLAPLN